MSTPFQVAILIETSRAYGRGLLEGVARYVQERGRWSIYFRPQGLGDAPPTWLRRWKGDGILARIDDERMARVVRATGLPAIDLRGRVPNRGWARVGVDNVAVARAAFQHLRERGLRRFAYCGPPRGFHPVLDVRAETFLGLVRQSGAAGVVFGSTVADATRPWEHQQKRLTRWVRELAIPVGVLSCNDDWGQQLLDACRRAGVRVPDEVAVISVENDPIVCNLATPPLTSIDVRPQQVGYEAAALLDRMMAGTPTPSGGIFLDQCRVVPRRSTDVLALDDPELARAVRLIRDRACSGLRVEEILGEICLSRSSLERRFREAFGRSPKAEILALQIERARQLLLETDWPLKQVAEACGFHSEKYFGEVFSLKTGQRPGQYRRSEARSRAPLDGGREEHV